ARQVLDLSHYVSRRLRLPPGWRLTSVWQIDRTGFAKQAFPDLLAVAGQRAIEISEYIPGIRTPVVVRCLAGGIRIVHHLLDGAQIQRPILRSGPTRCRCA